MSLSAEERAVVVGLELEKSDATFAQVQLGVDSESWDLVANRLYYAAFHAVAALLISRGIEVGTHKGANVMFNKDFVRTGIFSAEEGHLYTRLQQLREEGDYNCLIQTTQAEACAFIEPVRAFIAKIKTLL